MSNSIATLLLRNLSDVFGENDPVRRRAAIDELFHEDAVFYDPKGGIFRGRDEIGRIAGVIKATHPDFEYQPLFPPEELGDAGLTWRLILRKRLHHLLPCPTCRRVLRHVEVKDSAAMMSQHHKHEQHPKADRRHGEEVDRDEILDMVVQEGPPSLGRGFPLLGYEAGNRALRDRDSQLEQFPANARRTPIRVGDRQPLD